MEAIRRGEKIRKLNGYILSRRGSRIAIIRRIGNREFVSKTKERILVRQLYTYFHQETQMEKSKPSFIRIIQSDFIAMLGVLAPVVFLAAYIAVAYFGFLPGFRGHDPIQ